MFSWQCQQRTAAQQLFYIRIWLQSQPLPFFYLARSSRRWYYQLPCSPYSRTSEASDAMLSCKAVTKEKQVKSMLNANNMYLKTHTHTQRTHNAVVLC